MAVGVLGPEQQPLWLCGPEAPEGDAEAGAPYMPRLFVAAAGVRAAAAATTSTAAAVCFITSHVPVNSAVLSSSAMPYM